MGKMNAPWIKLNDSESEPQVAGTETPILQGNSVRPSESSLVGDLDADLASSGSVETAPISESEQVSEKDVQAESKKAAQPEPVRNKSEPGMDLDFNPMEKEPLRALSSDWEKISFSQQGSSSESEAPESKKIQADSIYDKIPDKVQAKRPPGDSEWQMWAAEQPDSNANWA